MTYKKKAVVICPAYNESENIEKIINIVFNSFPPKKGWDFHVLIVDGNSPDGTGDIVRKLISKYSKLHLLVEKEKAGLGAAYLRGMEYAFDEMKATHVFEIDADLSHDASKIPEFVEKLDKGYDLVLGTRYRNGGAIPSDWGIHRKFLSVMGNLYIRILFMDNRISDWTGGYKALSKKVYDAVKDQVSLEKGYTFQVSLNKKAVNSGFRVAEIPFVFKDRTAGESKLGPEYFINALFFVTKMAIVDFFKSTFFKVGVVGFAGFLVQTLFFYLFYEVILLRSPIAQAASAEVAIFSNYLLNNVYSFKHKKITGVKNMLVKFLWFNLFSLGSVLIQFITQQVGVTFFDETRLVVYTFFVIGIFLGLISNFYFYKNFVWKDKKN